MSSSPIRCLVVVSDIHAGSTKGLLPPDFISLEDNQIPQNPLQAWLWECWNRGMGFINEVMDGSPFALVTNGDLVEGVHHGTREIISPEVGDHKKAAIDILRPLAQSATKTFVVRGTECHVGNQEVSIAESLGAEINPESPAKNRAFDRLTLDVAGTRCVFRHHISASVRRNLSATQLSIALGEEQLEAANNNEPIPRVVVAAHRHRFGFFEDDNGICAVCPPWQFLTRHGHKVVSAARTKPGILILDWRGKKAGELPTLHRQIYACPQPKAVAL